METTTMMNLITFEGDDKFPVSGRELHERLEIGTEYSHWFKRMAEYGFEEGKDFSSDLTESTGGRPAINNQLSLDMAKHICMIQRTPVGMQIRQYLIEIEKSWQSEDKVLERAMSILHRRLDESHEKIRKLEDKATVDAPKVLFADSVCASKDSILVNALAKLISQNGRDIGQNRLFELMRNDGYLCSAKGALWNTPTQRAMDRGLFEIHERTVNNPDGTVRLVRTTKVTGKGQLYFINKYSQQVSIQEAI